MAVLFLDSFDHYATANLTSKWSGQTGTNTIGPVGQNSTNGLRQTNGDNQVNRALGVNAATLIVGRAFRFLTAPTTANYPLLNIRDGTTNQVRLVLNSLKQLELQNGSGAVLSTGTTVLSVSTFYYLELKATINNTTGSYELRINGTTEFSGTNADTQNSANAYANDVQVQGAGNVGGTNWDCDDLYVCDNSGTVNNDFLGQIRVQCIFPDGAGGVTQWTPLSGSNYANVNETAPDGDTTYNSDATIGDRDTYTFGALSPSTASIKAIQIVPYVRKDDAGSRAIAPVIRIGSTNYDQSTLPSLSTSYQYLPLVVENSPATTAPFTLSEVNGFEVGAKVVS